jgi:membrane protease YdiL (CAAX protease family)
MTRDVPGSPFPSPLFAFGIAFAASFVYVLIGSASESAFAAALAGAVAFGGLGTLAARFVPEPVHVRVGLMPFPARAALPLLLLVPAVLLTSELDNWIRLAFGAKSPAGLGKALAPDPQLTLLTVFLQPTLTEFFFRGVLLQGCVSSLGRRRGVLAIALFQTLLFLPMPVPAGDVGAAAAVSALAQTFALAALLGFVRLATGSVLPSIVLSSAMQAVGVAAVSYPDRVPIAGFNVPGATTPLAVLLPAAAAVGFGLWLLAGQLTREPALPPIPPRKAEDDEAGPLF